mgnify:CR=1 FL=1
MLVEEGVLFQFGARVGDMVKLGSASFRILGALRRVPGDTVAFSTIAPRVYLSATDLPATGLMGAKSLARFRVLFRLPPTVDVEKLREDLKPELERLRLSADTVKERQQDLGRALENLYRFLNLVALIALMLLRPQGLIPSRARQQALVTGVRDEPVIEDLEAEPADR